MRRLAEDAQQFRYELGQDLARALAAGRPQSAVMPAAHQRRDGSRIAKAEPREGAQGVGIVLDPCEDEISRAGEARRLFEQLGIVLLDRAEMTEQIGSKSVRMRIAEKDSDPLDPRAVRGQPVRLGVVHHLQAVFEPAQKAVVVDQRRGGAGIDATDRREPAQRLAGRPDPQLPQPPTPDQLLGLGKEFDLPNAAATGLDIVAFDRDSGAAAMSIDLSLDRVDVLDRGKIQVLAPEKGLQLAKEVLRRG